jgi:hypothetical protein
LVILLPVFLLFATTHRNRTYRQLAAAAAASAADRLACANLLQVVNAGLQMMSPAAAAPRPPFQQFTRSNVAWIAVACLPVQQFLAAVRSNVCRKYFYDNQQNAGKSS